MELCRELGIPIEERRISISEVYSACEAFTTGTMGELSPIREVDGRVLGSHGRVGPVTRTLQ